MSARCYLCHRHNEVAHTVLNSNLKKLCPDQQINLSSDTETIKTATKIPHNIPDLVIWNKETKLCM